MAEPEDSLKSLMLQALDGDGRAYGVLLTRLACHLRAYFGARLHGSGADLEDLVQETLLGLHIKRSTFERDQLLTPWVYAIARYKLVDHFRRSAGRRTSPLEHADVLLAEENPEEGAVRRDVETLLRGLPRRQGELLAAVKLEGLTNEEAARRHGMSLSAVKVSIHRGLKALSGKVEP